MEQRRTILAVVLSLAVYYLWMVWVSQNPVPEGAEVQTGAEIAQVDGTEPETTPATESVAATGAEAVPVPVPETPAAPAARPLPPVQEIALASGPVEGTWTTDGGALSSVHLSDHKAPFQVEALYRYVMRRFGGDDSPWLPYGEEPGPALLSTADARLVNVGTGSLDASGVRFSKVSASGDETVLRAELEDGLVIERTTRHGGDDYLVEIDLAWTNKGATPYTDALWVGMHDVFPAAAAGRYDSVARPWFMVDGDADEWDLEDMGVPTRLSGDVSWFGLADRYFLVALIPEGDDGHVYAGALDRGAELAPLHGGHYVLDGTLAPGETRRASFRLYAGPKMRGHLAEVAGDAQLEEAVQFGFFGFFAKLLLTGLVFFHGLIGNWGMAIIALTFTVKALLFPLTQMGFKSSQAMQSIQPELQRVREEYADDQEELNKRTFELFRENGVNPLGGCLPLVIQMPVWYALYSVLLYSVELYHTEFLYFRDLSSIDPYLAWPAAVVLLMVIQQQFMPTGNMDPAQARVMKLMPLLFGFFFFSFPAGLVLYISVNMVLSLLQQWFIKRQFQSRSPAPVAS